ncbi:hypothetical protein [Parafrankia sp. EUN1f]|uniref:hypothetical protein n=1 Tax=Parafrankia sp. EUN1f TaxID=102897 RepID=UPI0001C43F8A|nr:hypothetical protein [Parafrankia sp. EUN1f]EFC79229.1 hypothetical protein FrEUN1fDRAFT_7645 [Parafrankia sp. EUN1f]
MSTRRKHPSGNPGREPDDSTALVFTSGVNERGAPFIHVSWGGQRGQVTVAEARQIGHQALEAAEAAEHDAIVVAWLRDKMDLTLHQAAAALGDLRAYRQDTTTSTWGKTETGTGGPST